MHLVLCYSYSPASYQEVMGAPGTLDSLCKGFFHCLSCGTSGFLPLHNTVYEDGYAAGGEGSAAEAV